MDNLPDIASLQLAAVWTSVVAGVVGLVALTTGLFSLLSGRDHWPHILRRLRRRIPASEEDQRRNGLSLAFTGAAVLIVVMGTSIGNFTIGDHSIGEPLGTLRFVLTLVGLSGAFGCAIGSYSVSLTVKYTYCNLPAEARPAQPPT